MPVSIHVKYPLLLSDFNERKFLDRFSKNTQTLSFTESFPVGAELFHETRTDERTERREEANSGFSQFYKRL